MQHRVNGPYFLSQRSLWYVVGVSDTGKRDTRYFERQDKAEDYAKALKELQERKHSTVSECLTLFERHLTRCNNKRESIVAILYGVKRLLPDGEALAADIDNGKARSLYLSLTDKVAVDSHRASLSKAKQLWSFLQDEKIVTSNVWASVKPIGKKHRGKKHLSRDQARLLVAHCIAESQSPKKSESRAAIGVLFALLLGLRSCELVSLCKADFDDGFSTVRLSVSKTEAGKRYLRLPAVLHGIVAPVLKSMGDEELLFDCNTDWLSRRLKRLCTTLGLPQVSGHSLRGLFATLAVQAGATSTIAAMLLGHASDQVSKDHYIERGALDDQAVKDAENVLLH